LEGGVFFRVEAKALFWALALPAVPPDFPLRRSTTIHSDGLAAACGVLAAAEILEVGEALGAVTPPFFPTLSF